MPDWLIWLAAFWLLFGCGAGCRRIRSRRRLAAGGASADTRAVHSRSGSSAGASVTPASASSALPRGDAGPRAGKPESRLESLQRRFVDGALTLEQYEAELDRLDRKELG